jgi:hypothetical protein
MEKKVYAKRSEKAIDFLLGFFFIPALFSIPFIVLRWVLKFRYYTIISPIVALLEIIFIIYICIKRKYIGIGLLFVLVVVPLAFLGTCLLIMGGFNLFNIFNFK